MRQGLGPKKHDEISEIDRDLTSKLKYGQLSKVKSEAQINLEKEI